MKVDLVKIDAALEKYRSAAEDFRAQRDVYRAALQEILDVGSRFGDWALAAQDMRAIARKALGIE